jgi:hypothetical protein
VSATVTLSPTGVAPIGWGRVTANQTGNYSKTTATQTGNYSKTTATQTGNWVRKTTYCMLTI